MHDFKSEESVCKYILFTMKENKKSAAYLLNLLQMSSKDDSLLLHLPRNYLSSSPLTSLAIPTINTGEVYSSQFNFVALHCLRHLLEPFVTLELGTLP